LKVKGGLQEGPILGDDCRSRVPLSSDTLQQNEGVKPEKRQTRKQERGDWKRPKKAIPRKMRKQDPKVMVTNRPAGPAPGETAWRTRN
jgi:hypothetical protein